MASAVLNRRDGLFTILGSLLWIVGWIITLIAGGGSDTERVWRTLLVNPALFLFIVGLTGFHARQTGRSGQLGKTGFAVSLFGTATMLVGNVVEFWVSEYFFGTQTPGWVMMGIGLMMLPAGFVVLGIGTLRARVFTGWRRSVPLVFGLMLALLVFALIVDYWPGSRYSYEIHVVTIFGFALGWTALGYAFWSEKGESGRR
jgi:hypothetical protein